MAEEGFYESLHDDDDVAFAQVVEKLSNELTANLAKLESNDDPRLLQQDYMNKVVAAAEALDVGEIAGYDVPILDDMYPIYDEFALAVQRYAMKSSLRSVRTGKIYSVELTAAEKDRIHALIKKIREVLEGADLEDRKRNSLYAKLNAFNADVDRSRTPFNNAMLMALDVANVIKTYGESLKPLNEMLKRINDIIASAKGRDPEQAQLPPPPEKKKIAPPQKQIEGKYSRDIEDDIPF